MKQPFDLEWFGGAPERYFRKLRPGVEELPWGTLRPADYPPLLVERARISWTEAAFNEYCTAAAFSDLLGALLAVRAPIDLIGMASDFVTDELLHVELTARLAMELGGGAPYQVDFEALTRRLAPAPGAASAQQRANELVMRVCCVGEAFSVPMLSGCMQSAAHPLTRGVLEMIVRDEAPHGRFGWLYLDWCAESPGFDDAERARLAGVALGELEIFQRYWKRLRSTVKDGRTSEGFLLSHVNQLGWMDSESYAAAARQAVREGIVTPLARHGIELPPAAVDALLGA